LSSESVQEVRKGFSCLFISLIAYARRCKLTGAIVRAKDSFKGVYFKRYRFRKVIKDMFREYVYVLSLVFIHRPRAKAT
jgi:hypothetical protein